jgi:signal transduction histidine kinase
MIADMQAAGHPAKVLVLEDVETDAELILIELERAGVSFEGRAESNRSGLVKALREFKPDIVLSDFRLPGITGDEALSLCREHCPETPFILVTGAVGDETAVELMRNGASDFVLKDRMSRLGPAVSRALREARERQQRKAAEDGLRKAEAAIREAADSERRRLGHDLHDGLGQFLTGISFRAKALEEELETTKSPHASHAKEIVDLLRRAIHQTRTIAHGLDPVEVESIGLPAALQNLCAETEQLFKVTCSLESEDDYPAASRQALELYRIAQEAIHNAIRHGIASEIRIRLCSGAGMLTLSIRDNGKGFSVDSSPKGMGLRVMEYRSRSIGAVLFVESSPARGTEVRCRMPLKS